MKHPNRDEWLPYLSGESPPDARRHLDEHLDACAECAAEIAAWRRVENRLERWELPKLEKYSEDSFRNFRPLLKWAAAAVLILSVGFSLGWLMRRGSDSGDGRALAAESRQQLRQELSAEIQTAFAQVQSQSSNALVMLELRLARSSQIETRQLLVAVNEAFSRGREEDRRTALTLLGDLEQRHAAMFIALRRDLETVASFTDDNMRQARLKLVQLVANAEPTESDLNH
ncbi:MAG: hypothetical protein L0Z50_27210 [Verrucomicrobiales bacterium]|nr:hypothetical protein [Verrucomicrobiales bacterium]